MENKRNLLYLSLICLTFLLVSSCTKTIEGEGEVKTQSRNIKSFTSLSLDIPANITIVISDSVSCVISAQSNIADIITTDVNGAQLKLGSKYNYRPTKPVDIVLSTQALEKLIVNGSGDIQVLNTVKGSSLKLDINGSGDIDMNTDVKDLKTEINGSGDLKLAGKAATHRLQINGSGNVHAFGLSTDECKISLNGSGNAEVSVNSVFNAKIIGSGNILYKGSPTMKTDITGSGDVTKSKD